MHRFVAQRGDCHSRRVVVGPHAIIGIVGGGVTRGQGAPAARGQVTDVVKAVVHPARLKRGDEPRPVGRGGHALINAYVGHGLIVRRYR